MSQEPPFSDDPLPGLEPQAKTPGAAVSPGEAEPGHDEAALHDPDLKPQSSYGRSDPASLAALQSNELADPSLHAADAHALAAPDINPSPGRGLVDFMQKPPAAKPAGPDFSNWDPHLAHLAQVGLIAADHWEEQFKPRIDQLHDDITQVNEQLDDLEKAKRTFKKS
jgi:hypothetical protein